MIPTITTLSPPFLMAPIAGPVVLDPSLLARKNGAIVMTEQKDTETKSQEKRRGVLLKFLFILSFLPYFLPVDQRPGIYKTERHSDVSRQNRKFLNGHLDTLPWKDKVAQDVLEK